MCFYVVTYSLFLMQLKLPENTSYYDFLLSEGGRVMATLCSCNRCVRMAAVSQTAVKTVQICPSLMTH